MNVKSPLMVQGSIQKILTDETISAKLKVRTIHLGMKNGTYDTQIAIDFINDNIPLLNGFMPGEEVQVYLNLTGNISKKIPIKYIIISAVGKLNEWRVNLIVSNKTICDKRRSLLTILDFRICLRGDFSPFFF